MRSTAARGCAKNSHATTAGGVWRSSAVSARGIAATCKNWCRKHRTGTASAMAPSRCSVVRASRCCGGRETKRLVLHVSVLDRAVGTRRRRRAQPVRRGHGGGRRGKWGGRQRWRLRRSSCARAREIGEGGRGAPTVAGPVAGPVIGCDSPRRAHMSDRCTRFCSMGVTVFQGARMTIAKVPRNAPFRSPRPATTLRAKGLAPPSQLPAVKMARSNVTAKPV